MYHRIATNSHGIPIMNKSSCRASATSAWRRGLWRRHQAAQQRGPRRPSLVFRAIFEIAMQQITGSIDWFKGNITGRSHIYPYFMGKSERFPVDFPLSQRIDWRVTINQGVVAKENLNRKPMAFDL